MKNIQKLILMLFVFLVVSSLVFVSCSGCNGADGGNDCVVFKSCSSDADCKDEPLFNVCDGGECRDNPCEKSGISCGMGKCIPHDNPETKNEKEWYYCQCDEGATFYVDVCVLDCDNNATCEEFSKTSEIWEAFEYCDTEKGHCVNYNPNN